MTPITRRHFLTDILENSQYWSIVSLYLVYNSNYNGMLLKLYSMQQFAVVMFLKTMYNIKQLSNLVLVISGIIKISVSVISLA